MKLHILAAWCFIVIHVVGGSPERMESSGLAKICDSAFHGDEAAINSLRAMGQRGLDALLSHQAKLVTGLRDGSVAMDDVEAVALRKTADTVARQRDAHASGLFWFTDLDAAKAEAKKSKKLILSLRLLGNLDDEFSCANSRFFRTVLYANADVSRELRDKYVLHWKSVRPVPRITIDMGDGRRIQRTITGNSIHYVLDSDGLVLDALPGLYGPKAFLAALQWAPLQLSPIQLRALRQRKTDHIQDLHGKLADYLCMSWLEDAIKAGVYGPSAKTEYQGRNLEEQTKLLLLLKRAAFPVSKKSSDKVRDGQSSSPVGTGEHYDVARVLGQRIAKMPPGHLEPVDAIYPNEFSPSKGMVERPILQQTAQHQAAVQPSSAALKPAEAIGQIILPQLKFEGATLEEAVEVIRIKTKEVTQSKDLHLGINVIIRGRTEPNKNPISMELRDVPAIEALRYAAEIAKMKFSIENGIVVIAPLPKEDTTGVNAEDIDELLKRSASSALTAASRADAKSMVERPILNKVQSDVPVPAPNKSPDPFYSPNLTNDKSLAERMTPALWNQIALLHLDDARLDLTSRRFMMSKLPADTITADERASGCVKDNRTPFARTLQRLEMSVAEDTVKNEYLFHAQIHQWLEEDTEGKFVRDVETLNKRVYAELFLTPDYDEWLGLVPEDTYTALEKDGCACDKGALPMRRK